MRNPTESKVNTVVVPPVGTDPSTLWIAADFPVRVVVRNVGGNILILAHDSSTLANFPPGNAGTFVLPAGDSEVFVLQPRQGIYASGSGGGGLASIAVSEALPQTWMES